MKQSMTINHFDLVRSDCIQAEKVLRKILHDMDDGKARVALEELFRVSSMSDSPAFTLSASVPLMIALSTIEQTWSEWSHPEYRQHLRIVFQDQLDILTGRKVLLHKQSFPSLQGDSRTKWFKFPKPSWYLLYLQAFDIIMETRTLNKHILSNLVNTVSDADPRTVTGHLAGLLLSELTLDRYRPAWYQPNDILEQLPSKIIDWERMSALLAMLSRKTDFDVNYTCTGWRYVSCSISE